jgi:hypothetical protein
MKTKHNINDLPELRQIIQTPHTHTHGLEPMAMYKVTARFHRNKSTTKTEENIKGSNSKPKC